MRVLLGLFLLLCTVAVAVHPGQAAFWKKDKPAATAASSAEKRTVRIAMEGAYAPFNVVGIDGKLKGFDVDIANAICAQANFNCVFTTQAWDGLIPGLQTGKYDLIVSSLSITEERKEAVAFSNRYYRTPIRFIAPRDSALIISDDGLKGKTIGAQRATTSSSYLEDRFGNSITVKLYDTQENGLLDLSSGRLDAYIADALMTWDWLQTPVGQRFSFRGETFYVDQGIGMAARKGDADLITTVNTALAKILEDGTYEKINAKYFPFSIY